MEGTRILTYADKVITAIGDNASPRTKEAMSSLIRHLHVFVIEVNLTREELFLGIDMVGQPLTCLSLLSINKNACVSCWSWRLDMI